ncbi:hypothetical protein BDY19DRAFT_998886 [Irpex rosettiformis]|uniref:Uncharacterized protein n=1 Tax=Irpex rosettiformis TaxID=378272 RepID=A0ACB8TM80_9APHY|nr:hypothetical protein BDY19DRAFT_998886 [Irpex rosettiformis]
MSASDLFGVEISLPVSTESLSAMISALGVDDLSLDEFAQMLGQQTYEQYKTQGDLDDLETLSSAICGQNAIALHARAVELIPDHHPGKPSILNSSGCSLLARFVRLGNIEDPNSAVALHTRAVHLAPDGHRKSLFGSAVSLIPFDTDTSAPRI